LIGGEHAGLTILVYHAHEINIVGKFAARHERPSPAQPETALRGLSQDLGITLQKLDPEGGVQGVENYIALMQYNAAQIAAALRE